MCSPPCNAKQGDTVLQAMLTYSSRSLCNARVRHSRLYHAAALAKLY